MKRFLLILALFAVPLFGRVPLKKKDSKKSPRQEDYDKYNLGERKIVDIFGKFSKFPENSDCFPEYFDSLRA